MKTKSTPHRIHKSFLTAFNHPNFRLFFSGQLISVSGTWMQRVAQGWLVFSLTQSEWWLGVVAGVSGITMLLAAPLAGAWIDRWSRRKLLILAQTGEMIVAFLLAYLTFTSIVRVEQIVIMAGCLGLIAAVGEPARQALLKELVGKADIASGLSLNATMSNVAAIIGPALAGIALLRWGAGWCFLMNGLSYLAVIVSLVFVRVKDVERTAVSHPHVWQQVQQGIHYVAQTPGIAVKILSATVSSAIGIGMIQVLLPAYASTILKQPEIGLVALSIALGFGSIIAASGNVWLGSRWGQTRLATLSMLILPFGSLLLALTNSLSVAVLIAGILGFGYTVFFVTTNTLLQLEVDDVYRGRVLSLWSMNRFGISPISALAIGGMAQLLGISATFTLCGLLAFILCYRLMVKGKKAA